MDLNDHQVAAIISWAKRTPEIAGVALFGSRAKGTSRPDSDVDIALAFHVPDFAVEELFRARGQAWQSDLRTSTELLVNIAHLAGELTPRHTRHVEEHGIWLYRTAPAHGA